MGDAQVMSHQTSKISVALCTYNGERFIREQLSSIAAQTLPPVEVVVCDDGSTDSTVEIVQEFGRSSTFPVRLYRNEKNLGLARNFGKAIGLCAGDIIALSDQDDVWRADKLAATAWAFENDAELTLIFTDADLVDVDLKPLGRRLSDTGHIDEEVRRTLAGADAFSFLLRRNVATGATMAFRSELRDLVLPIPEGLLTYHDAWIVQLAAATSTVAFLPEPLMQYRQHSGQHTWDFVYVHGARRVLDKAYYAAHLNQLVETRNRLATKTVDNSRATAAITLLDGYIEHLRRRSTLPAGRLGRVGPIFAELMSGRYRLYSSGWRSAARDLFSGAAQEKG
jgi:glycosyltransferase involved in cell wall biosynthesis